MYREVIFLAKKTLELWNPSSSLILSLEKNECNENCLFIWETVIVSQPVYSFPTTWCCICIESSLKFWRAVSKRNESKYTPFFSICNFWIAMAFLKRISKWPYWAWIIVKRNSGSDISWIFPNMKFCWNVLLFIYQVLSRLSFISALGMMTRITSQVSSFQITELRTLFAGEGGRMARSRRFAAHLPKKNRPLRRLQIVGFAFFYITRCLWGVKRGFSRDRPLTLHLSLDDCTHSWPTPKGCFVAKYFMISYCKSLHNFSRH